MTIIPLHTDIIGLLGGKGVKEMDMEMLYDQGAVLKTRGKKTVGDQRWKKRGLERQDLSQF